LGKYSDITISCIQCGKGFIFTEDEQEFYKSKGYTPPLRCKQCRSAGRQHNVCTRCGNKLIEGSPVYCAACHIDIQLEFEVKAKGLQSAIESANARLEASGREKEQALATVKERLNLAEADKARLIEEARTTETLVEAEKAKMMEILSQKEQLIADLEKRLQNPAGELEKALKSLSNLERLEPMLNMLKEKIETLERNQSSLKEGLITLVEMTEENYRNVSIPEAIKGLFKFNHRSPAHGG
jgi:hypothetical protein